MLPHRPKELIMNNKTKWITRSAISIALIIVIQLATRGFGQQLITGSLVNLVLAFVTFLYGWSVGAVAAIVSPFIAYLLGINAQILVVPAIAIGNLTYVLVTAVMVKALKGTKSSGDGKLIGSIKTLAAVVIAAACKFGIQYLLIVKWIAPSFLPEKAQAVMAVNFGVMQLFTACIGGVLACLIYPLVSAALKDMN